MTGCIISKKKTLIIEMVQILQRKVKYNKGQVFCFGITFIEKLIDNNRREKLYNIWKHSTTGSVVWKSDIKTALDKRKRKKVAGADEIVMKILSSLEHFGIDKHTEINDSNEMPQDLSRSISVVMPKKPGTN